MTRVPYLDLKAQYQTIRAEVLASLEAVCESARFAQGPPTAEFEKNFAEYCGVKHCVSLNSGTSALHLAMRCLNIGPDDEVITTPFTFIATAWAISYVGAWPVFVDIEPTRRALDPAKLEAAITPRTKAIMPVHLYGMPADMEPILKIAAKYRIPVVEDAAQSHGASYKGKRCGQFGCMAGFSFYPGKNLGAYGEGGALVTNDDDFAARARSLREHGSRERYYHDEVGYNYRMDSFQGAVLNIKLKHLDAWSAARQMRARRYNELLTGTGIGLPKFPADSESVWHCYVIEIENRDAVRQKLADAGIDTAVHYPVPVHLQKAYESLDHTPGDFPVSEALAGRCLSLPIYPEMTDAQQDAVVAALKAAR
ncbi:MAG: DegT/DnrJ/EryC1/StrS family aminotransferase [Verrucomicrobia bacterium]|nr:DegT/DnrJ/EryC1/StrS family aminotransferase [Verrucomicrobiota bacterium]